MQFIYRFCQRLREMLPRRAFWAVIFAALAGVFAGRALIGSVCVVEGVSMDPTFKPGNYVLTVRISTPLARGDIVAVDDGSGRPAMKRIVGMPGETVQLWRGHIFINRKMLVEPYLQKHTYTFVMDQPGAVELRAGQYFVLGDNRPVSLDSRTYGPVGRQQIKRRIPSPEGTLRADFVPYTLPPPGKLLIQALYPNKVPPSRF